MLDRRFWTGQISRFIYFGPEPEDLALFEYMGKPPDDRTLFGGFARSHITMQTSNSKMVHQLRQLSFRPTKNIWSGPFSEVHVGHIGNNKDPFVQKVHKNTIVGEESFINEFQLHAWIDSDSAGKRLVSPLVGVNIVSRIFYFPSCKQGDLYHYITTYSNDTDTLLKLKICLSIASTLNLLHQQKIIHQDVKPGKYIHTRFKRDSSALAPLFDAVCLLLFVDVCCCLSVWCGLLGNLLVEECCHTTQTIMFCDLGLSVRERQVMPIASPGTAFYTDPAILLSLIPGPKVGVNASRSNDLYALAGTFLFVLTANEPWNHRHEDAPKDHTNHTIICDAYRTSQTNGLSRFKLSDLLPSSANISLPASIVNLLQLMFSFQPSERPQLSNIISVLKSSINSFKTDELIRLLD
jgi:serine/threonine protein kinase